MKTKLFVSIALVLAVGLAGCAKVPTEKVTAAETAISAAMSAEAQIYAPQAMAAARDSLNAAKAEIAQEVARAKEDLRHQVSSLAIAGAEKILQREVDAKAHADLLAEIQRQV